MRRDRDEAKQVIEEIIKKDFKYLYRFKELDKNTVHLSFIMDSKCYNLQMTIKFEENWADILCFISPTILTTNNNNNYWEAIQTINYINWNIKSWGRFYIDTYGDLAYSLRINYNVLERMPQESIGQMESTVDYYSDLFIPLLNVCQGKATFGDIKQFIDDMWGGLQ